MLKVRLPILAILGCFIAVAFLQGWASGCVDPIDAPAEVQVGDRLFRETRFAQFFFNFITAAPNRDVNTRLKPGDPVMNNEQNAAGKPLRDPFRNQSMNCRNWTFHIHPTGCAFSVFSHPSSRCLRACIFLASSRSLPTI